MKDNLANICNNQDFITKMELLTQFFKVVTIRSGRSVIKIFVIFTPEMPEEFARSSMRSLKFEVTFVAYFKKSTNLIAYLNDE